ncbi:PREDICTED: pre-mRNA-splicing factor CWC22 homolog isoform X1 [Populus euphratica]|uniref:Pre-mRNA-splicing factor CWC22 homolog isoform X1 n=2 Tax=Populus euphratica TaxID=75702 RepID=A0AAJ6VG01_POPEU|nr:PREDICTED: pre-mRNA-splicing factor CWC22 homolog isoform X1 [Populus euphratica]
MPRRYSSSSLESSDEERDRRRLRDSKRDSKSDSHRIRGGRGDESDESLDNKRHDKRDERSRRRDRAESDESLEKKQDKRGERSKLIDRARDEERFSRERKEVRESSEEEGELVEKNRSHEGRRENREREKEKEKEKEKERVSRSSDEEDDRRKKRERRERERNDRFENGHRRREIEDSYRRRDRHERHRALDDEDDSVVRTKSEQDRNRDRRRIDRDYDDGGDRRNGRGKERNKMGKEAENLKEKEDGRSRTAEESKPRREMAVEEGNGGADASILGKTGGVYIPPFRLARMMKEVEDKSSTEYQRLTWDALRKSINGLVNKVNASNIKNIIPELFSENLIRGRGLFCRSCMKSQMASSRFTDVFAALVAVVNTKFPEVGDLLLRRIVLQLKRAFKRNDKPQLLAAVKFIAHLVNQQVAHEIIALELLAVLLENPTDDSVEVAVGFVTECGSMLQDVSPKGLDGAFERFRGILHEGEIDKRVQFLIEGLFAIRKAKFQGYPAVRPELDLVDQEDQLTHEISLSEDIVAEITLDVFKPDPNFLENEKRYEELKKSILGEESEDEDGSDAASGDEEDDDDDDEDESEEEDEEQMRIDDQTETNLINLRRTIYLTIMSSVDFEEAGHKLLKIKLEPGQEMELCIMLLECCSQERTYLRYYGLLGQRFCMINKVHQENFEKSFVQQYSMIHRLETNKLRNVAKFFAHLLGTDALPWHVLAYIRLTEEDTTSSSRIFIKILFQELSEHLGIRTLNERLTDPTMRDSFDSIFPKDNPKNTRFAINFFTSIGLGGITENLREYLKNMPRMIMQQQEQLPESESGSDEESESSGSSDSDSSSSESESDSPSSDEDERGRKRHRSSDRDERHKKRHRSSERDERHRKRHRSSERDERHRKR